MSFKIGLYCLTLLVYSLILQAECSPIIQVKNGFLKGVTGRDSTSGKTYEAFYGIPFGKPTGGNMRFKKPKAAEGWIGIRDASSYGPSCPSALSVNSSEDCLYLNVFAPGNSASRVNRSMPILMFIHGGAFLFGSASLYHAEHLSTSGEVIVVTTNYRLGVFGFLSNGDTALPGNNGLWDVLLALRWVHDNMAAISGADTKRITLIGQSAGAAIVSHLMVSPKAEGLFRRAILISGGSTGFIGTTAVEHAKKTFQSLTSFLLCDEFLRKSNVSKKASLSTDQVLECLRSSTPEELIIAEFAVSLLDGRLPNSQPVIDNDLIPDNPRRMFVSKEGQRLLKDIDLLVGFTKHEGAFLTLLKLAGGNMLPDELNYTLVDEKDTLKNVLRVIFGYFRNVDSLIDFVYTRFPLLSSEKFTNRAQAATTFFTDWLFSAGAHFEAESHSKVANGTSKTYVYRYDYRSSIVDYPKWVTALHGDDLFSVFGPPFVKEIRKRRPELPDFSKRDYELSRKVISYYTNFARDGNPSIKGENEWPLYTSNSSHRLMFIQNPNSTTTHVTTERLKSLREWYSDKFPQNSQRHTHKNIKQSEQSELKLHLKQARRFNNDINLYKLYQRSIILLLERLKSSTGLY